jgi:hypothetical protein
MSTASQNPARNGVYIWKVYFARVCIARSARGYFEGISATFWASCRNYNIYHDGHETFDFGISHDIYKLVL